MKSISQWLLVVVAATSLIACQQSGSGPSKPANSQTTKIAQ